VSYAAPVIPARILVVEDQSDIQLTLRLSLEADGYDVVVASRADEALDAIERLVPDLILLDITLPGVSGWDLLSTIRADERFASVPIIVLSALPHESVSGRASELGAGHLAKPFNVNTLIDKVRGALESGRLS
jgi:DNA-binding response OmpR family regulator